MTGRRGAPAPRWPTHDEPVGLAPGVRLLGPYASSGLRGQHFLAERADGQVVHLSRLLHLVVSEADGRRSGAEVAERVSARYGRQLTPDGVDYLVENKLGPAGLIAPVGATAPPRTAEPLLALRLRRTLLPARPTGWVADLLAPLYHPLVVAILLGAFAAVEVAVFHSGRILPALHQVLVMPGALVAVLGLLLLSGLFHECGHAAACAYSGSRPGKIGVGIYLVMPAFYTDVTSAYQLDRTGRLRTDLGGLYFNSIVVLGLAASYAAVPTPALLVAILLVNLEMLQQLLPIVRLDGYFILSDLIGIPDLFGRIGPVLSGLLPGRPTHARAAQLRPYARRRPHRLGADRRPAPGRRPRPGHRAAAHAAQTTWHAIDANWASLQSSRPAGNASGVLLAGIAIVAARAAHGRLVLLYENLARTGLRSARGLVRRHHQGRPAVQPDDAPLAEAVPATPMPR